MANADGNDNTRQYHRQRQTDAEASTNVPPGATCLSCRYGSNTVITTGQGINPLVMPKSTIWRLLALPSPKHRRMSLACANSCSSIAMMPLRCPSARLRRSMMSGFDVCVHLSISHAGGDDIMMCDLNLKFGVAGIALI